MKEIDSNDKFYKLIENRVRDKHQSYIDAILDICEDHSLNVEDMRKHISPSIKSKIEAEAKSNRMIKGGNSTTELPI